MTTAEKIYENFVDKYCGHHSNRPPRKFEFCAYMDEFEDGLESEKESGAVFVWGDDYCADNRAEFKDGSVIVWNYKNEIEIY